MRSGPDGTLSDYARAVLEVVGQIPRGAVMSYGDVAEFMGRGTARTVGMVMSRHGHEVPWHRVVQASGRPAEPLWQEALDLLRKEQCPVLGDRVDMAIARWNGG